jgi:hypothetical protein
MGSISPRELLHALGTLDNHEAEADQRNKRCVSTKAVRWRVCVAKRSDYPLLPSRRAGRQLKRNAAIRFQMV